MAYKFGKPFHVYEAFDKVNSSPLLAHYQSEQITVLFSSECAESRMS